MPRSARAARSRAAPPPAPSPAPSRPTSALHQRNAAATDVAPPSVPVPLPPPSAQRSCVRRASSAPGNNLVAAFAGLRDRTPSHAEKRISSSYLRRIAIRTRLSDSVRLAQTSCRPLQPRLPRLVLV